MTSRRRTQEVRDTIARRVRELRRALGLTQEQLSEKAGIAPQYLSRLETARQLPSLDTVVDLAEALNTTPSALLAEPMRDSQSERAGRLAAMLSTLAEEDAAFLESQLAAWASHFRDVRRQV